MGLFSNLFSKKECSFCGSQVGVFKRDALVNKEGYIYAKNVLKNVVVL